MLTTKPPKRYVKMKEHGYVQGPSLLTTVSWVPDVLLMTLHLPGHLTKTELVLQPLRQHQLRHLGQHADQHQLPPGFRMDLLVASRQNVHLAAANGGPGRFKISVKTIAGQTFAMVVEILNNASRTENILQQNKNICHTMHAS